MIHRHNWRHIKHLEDQPIKKTKFGWKMAKVALEQCRICGRYRNLIEKYGGAYGPKYAWLSIEEIQKAYPQYKHWTENEVQCKADDES